MSKRYMDGKKFDIIVYQLCCYKDKILVTPVLLNCAGNTGLHEYSLYSSTALPGLNQMLHY